jgi:hypothetical protein
VLDIPVSGVDRLAASRTHRDSCSISMRDILPVPGPFLPASLWIPPGRPNLSPRGHSAKRAHRARFIAVANRGGSALGAEMFVPRAGVVVSERFHSRTLRRGRLVASGSGRSLLTSLEDGPGFLLAAEELAHVQGYGAGDAVDDYLANATPRGRAPKDANFGHDVARNRVVADPGVDS